MARAAGKTKTVEPSGGKRVGHPGNCPASRESLSAGRMIPDEELRAVSEGSFQPDRSLRLRNTKTVRRVFADTLYWLAVFLPGDTWTDAAHAADVSEALLITTEEVLAEFHVPRWFGAV
jgi:hypothetical protein